ncbi:MAG: AAA family ATPase [Myxococcota bacterium]
MSSSSRARGLPVGTILASRYQVRRELGRGGMGYVYLCRDLVLDERVALKLMPRSKSEDEGSTKRKKGRHDDAWFFYEEARALAGLDHPSIVRARDYGVLSDGAPFLVMDVVPGRSLHEWIYRARTDGLLPWPVVWTTIDQVLGGLGHAHARGIIHGDLKPSNILLHRPPANEPARAYVLDLGLAWLTRDLVDHRLDGSREVPATVRYGAGTPGWMAPEQIRMATPHIGPATDLYPIGCLLYTLLVGEEPFEGTNEELLDQHKNTPVPDFEVEETVPQAAISFVKRLMAKWPWNRYMFAADARRDWHAMQPAESFPSMLPPPRLTQPPRSSQQAVSDVQSVPEGAEGELRTAVVATPGLLGVRPSPLVARNRERQALLDEAEVIATSEDRTLHRLILLSGPAGVGKSKIAEWLCQHAHEEGLLLPLRVRYRKIDAPLDGIVGALVQQYRVEKVKRTTIEKVLMNLWRVRTDDDEGLTWVAGAATWLCRNTKDADALGPTKKRFILDRPELKWLVMRKTLEKTSQGRPLLIWLDDLHRAPAETFQHLARLKRDLKHVPLMILATMRNEDVANDPTARARIELLVEEYQGRRIEVEPLDYEQTKALLQETLPLTEDALNSAASRAKGNPLFALQLLHSWAMRGDLQLDSDGNYAVSEAALERPANTTAELWEERVRALPRDLQPAALSAAALGGDIRRDVLRVQLAELGLDAGRAIGAMKRAQLLLPAGTERLRWTHALLQEYLLSRLQETPGCRRVFLAAANALAHHPAANSGRIVRHRVTNLVRAGELDTAAELLHGHVASSWAQVRDAAVTQRDRARVDEQLSGIPVARHLRWRAEASRHAGSLEEARRHAEIARRSFRDHGDELSEAQCLRLLGHIASDLGASAQGRRLVIRALTLFRRHGDVLGQAQCEVLLGEIDYLVGEHRRALDSLNQAAAKFSEANDTLGRAQCYILQGFIEQSGGSPTHAREILEIARTDLERIGYRLGVAQCDLALAHADHRDGDFDEAHERASRTIKAFRLIENPRGEAGCERLLAMNALDGGHPNTAEVHARAAGVIYARLNDPWGRVEALLLLAQVALFRGDNESARESLIRCEAVALAEAEPKQHRHLTLAWLSAAEERWSDAAREIDAARRTFKDASQSGDHTPQLLESFADMAWQEPAAARVDAWRQAITRHHPE